MKFLAVFISIVLLAFFAFVFVMNMDDSSSAEQALINAGFSHPTCSENHWFLKQMNGCSEDDSFAWDCTAINSKGKKINVTVCTGLLFKKATIRY